MRTDGSPRRKAARPAAPPAARGTWVRRPAGLGGARVALLESRMGGELADLVRRHGGVPLVAPAVRERPLDASGPVATLIERLGDARVDCVVFLTGVGADGLFAAAERMGKGRELAEGLRSTTTVCRGHKPRAALRRRGIPVSVMVAEPYTTADVVAALRGLELAGRGVAIIHYGERNTAIAEALEDCGSGVLDLCLYEWALPEDTVPLQRLIDGIVAGMIEAVAFTSQVQVRHLLAVAAGLGCEPKLVQALNGAVTVAAVGPTCAEALRAAGIAPRVVPDNPKMGPMIVALAEHFTATAPGGMGERRG